MRHLSFICHILLWLVLWTSCRGCKGGGDNAKMTFIDMFCGMGTIRMGFEQAGHECVYSVEWDKHKRKIYEVIFGNEPEGRDITAVRADDLPHADCWAFGAPCQDFSIAGPRSGMDGDRSSLVREVFRLVRETPEEHRPEWLLYENVKGMLSSNKGLDYLEILFEMASLGYDIQYQLLNSKDFGVPQNRERVYTLGHSRRFSPRKVFPIGGQSNEYSTVGKSTETAVARTLTGGGHSGGNHSGMTILQVKQIYGTAAEPNPSGGRVYSTDGIMRTLGAGHGMSQPIIEEPRACLTPDRLEKRQNGRRFKEPDEPMFTLTKQDIHGVKQGFRIRRLTPRECMRLQGVPDYTTGKLVSAGISDTQLYRAAGDACTVNVIYEIAKAIGKCEKEVENV